MQNDSQSLFCHANSTARFAQSAATPPKNIYFSMPEIIAVHLYGVELTIFSPVDMTFSNLKFESFLHCCTPCTCIILNTTTNNCTRGTCVHCWSVDDSVPPCASDFLTCVCRLTECQTGTEGDEWETCALFFVSYRDSNPNSSPSPSTRLSSVYAIFEPV